MKIVKTLITMAILYGAYHVYKTHDFTIIPPTDTDVKEAFRQSNPNAVDTKDPRKIILTITKPCQKIQGGITDGVYSCNFEVYSRSTSKTTEYTNVHIAKRKGNWYVKQMPQ